MIDHREIPQYEDPRTYDHFSRYAYTRKIYSSSDELEYHESQNLVVIPNSDDDIYITIDSSLVNRLDKLSLEYYNNPTHWWLIALANDIINPLDELPYGKVIRIPPIEYLSKLGGVPQ